MIAGLKFTNNSYHHMPYMTLFQNQSFPFQIQLNELSLKCDNSILVIYRFNIENLCIKYILNHV